MPALLKCLSVDGSQIVLARSRAIDEPLLVNLINPFAKHHRTADAFSLDFHALPREPIKLIKVHILLGLFGLVDLAQSLSEHMWAAFGSYQLALEDVVWIWATLGPHTGALWVPPPNTLDEELRSFFETKGKVLKPLMGLFEKRLHEYRLERQKQPVRDQSVRTQSELVIEQANHVYQCEADADATG
ncbi:hypothetical protein SVAN01_06948 [Stagonosporopsis vannaccii]|nr:hypothetical protein SVAN01_06948 [Stagonosporopsis vannaccii]